MTHIHLAKSISMPRLMTYRDTTYLKKESIQEKQGYQKWSKEEKSNSFTGKTREKCNIANNIAFWIILLIFQLSLFNQQTVE